jgi:hypothetical protein
LNVPQFVIRIDEKAVRADLSRFVASEIGIFPRIRPWVEWAQAEAPAVFPPTLSRVRGREQRLRK